MAGWALMTFAFAGLGLVELLFAGPLPDLHIHAADAPNLARLSGTLLLIFSLCMLAGRFTSIASLLVALYWAFFGILAVTDVLARAPFNLAAWVPVAEIAVFVTASLARGIPPRWAATAARPLLRMTLGLGLVLFGVVHAVYHAAIGGMIPAWIPFAAEWPWATSVINGIAGLCILAGRGTAPAALVIAAMFGSWLPLVHAGRLAAEPENLFEWTFALTAAALTGAALVVAASQMKVSAHP